MRKRPGYGAIDGHVHGDETGRSKVRIETGEKFEVEASIGDEIEGALAGELHGAVHSEVGPVSHHMELLNVDRLIGEREVNRILVVHLNVFDVEGDRREITLQAPLRGQAERTAQLKRAGDSGKSGGLAAGIGTPKGVDIKLVHLECEVGRISVAQLNVATDQ